MALSEEAQTMLADLVSRTEGDFNQLIGAAREDLKDLFVREVRTLREVIAHLEAQFGLAPVEISESTVSQAPADAPAVDVPVDQAPEVPAEPTPEAPVENLTPPDPEVPTTPQDQAEASAPVEPTPDQPAQ